jgi:hypothetical protein
MNREDTRQAAADVAQPSLAVVRPDSSTSPTADDVSSAPAAAGMSLDTTSNEPQSVAVPFIANASPLPASQPQATSKVMDLQQPTTQSIDSGSRVQLSYPELAQGFERHVDVAR